MNEAVRNAIVERRQAGASQRAIARELGISRHSVARVLARLAANRNGQVPAPALPLQVDHGALLGVPAAAMRFVWKWSPIVRKISSSC